MDKNTAVVNLPVFSNEGTLKDTIWDYCLGRVLVECHNLRGKCPEKDILVTLAHPRFHSDFALL